MSVKDEARAEAQRRYPTMTRGLGYAGVEYASNARQFERQDAFVAGVAWRAESVTGEATDQGAGTGGAQP